MNTFRIIAEHESAVAKEQSLCPAVRHEFQRELRNISREVENYLETSHKFLHMADDLKSMYDNILTFHGQELQHDTSLKLAQLSQADAAGNRDMAVLANLTHKDSRSMRIATAIAMFYLPVNLVMSFFSSTLVSYGTGVGATENDSSRMQVRSDVWIAAVAALVLAISTACWSWWWNWKEQKKSDKKAFQEATIQSSDSPSN